jgi:hypothetical protein
MKKNKIKIYNGAKVMKTISLIFILASLPSICYGNNILLSTPTKDRKVTFINEIDQGILSLKKDTKLKLKALVETTKTIQLTQYGSKEVDINEKDFLFRKPGTKIGDYSILDNETYLHDFTHLELIWEQTSFTEIPDIEIHVEIKSNNSTNKNNLFKGYYSQKDKGVLDLETSYKIYSAENIETDYTYLIKRELGLKVDEKWRYRSDGDRTILQRRVDLPFEEAQQIKIITNSSSEFECIQFSIDSDGNGKRDGYILSHQTKISKDIEDDKIIYTIDLRGAIKELNIKTKKALLMEPIIFMNIDVNNYLSKKPIHKLIFYGNSGEVKKNIAKAKFKKKGNINYLNFNLSNVYEYENLKEGLLKKVTIILHSKEALKLIWKKIRFLNLFEEQIPLLAIEPENALKEWSSKNYDGKRYDYSPIRSYSPIIRFWDKEQKKWVHDFINLSKVEKITKNALWFIDIDMNSIDSVFSMADSEWWYKEAELPLVSQHFNSLNDDKKTSQSISHQKNDILTFCYGLPNEEFLVAKSLVIPERLSNTCNRIKLKLNNQQIDIPKECLELPLNELSSTINNFKIEFDCPQYFKNSLKVEPRLKVLGLKRKAYDDYYLPKVMIDGKKIKVDIVNSDVKWCDFGSIDLEKGKHFIELKDSPFYKIKKMVLESEDTTEFFVEGIEKNKGQKGVRIFAFLIYKLFISVGILISLFVLRSKIIKLLRHLKIIAFKTYKKVYYSLPEQAWAISFLFLCIVLYSYGIQKKINGENYEITFAGIFIVLFLWQLGNIIRKRLGKKARNIEKFVYENNSNHFFFWSLVLLIIAAVSLIFKIDLLAEQIGNVIYYFIVAGTISDVFITRSSRIEGTLGADGKTGLSSNPLPAYFFYKEKTGHLYEDRHSSFSLKTLFQKLETFFNLEIFFNFKIGQHILPVSILIISCIIYCSPVLFSMNNFIPSEGDNNGFLNELSMVQRWLENGDPIYTNSYVGYPYNNETYVPSSPLSMVLSYLISIVTTKTIALNANLFLTFIITAILTYALAYKIKPDRFYASLVSFFFLYSPIHWSHLPAISMIWCVPFLIFCFLKFINDEKLSILYLLASIVLTCFIGLYQYFYFSFLFVVCFSIYLIVVKTRNHYEHDILNKRSLNRKILRFGIVSILGLSIGALPYIVPLIQYINEPALKSSMINFTSSNFGSWNSELIGYITPYFYRGGFKYSITPSDFYSFFPRTICPNNYLGIIGLLMGIFGVKYFRNELKNNKLYLFIFVFFFVFSLGTYLKISSNIEITELILPYKIFKFIPGFSFLRAPGRLAITAAFIIALFAPLVIIYYYKKKKYVYVVFFLVLSFIDSRFVYHFPFDRNKIYEPKVYESIIATDDQCKAVIQLPFISFSPIRYAKHAIDIGKTTISPLSQRPLNESFSFVLNLEYLSLFYQPDLFFARAKKSNKIFDIKEEDIRKLYDKLNKYQIKYIILHKYFYNLKDQFVYDPEKRTHIIKNHYTALVDLFGKPMYEDDSTILFSIQKLNR